MTHYVIDESPVSHFFLSDTRVAALWLIARLYLGWSWLQAGWEKLQNPAWIGDAQGAAMTGFVQRALTKTSGAHPDVQGWYAAFLEHAVLPYADLWSYAIVFGELAVGLALIAGCLTGIAAFAGLFMNFNFLLAGSVSINPIMAALSIGIVLAWRVAGYWGMDRFVLPLLHRAFRPRRSARVESIR